MRDLASQTREDLLAIDHIGPASVEEIKQKLADRGLTLADSPASSNGLPGAAARDPAAAATAAGRAAGARGRPAATAPRPARPAPGRRTTTRSTCWAWPPARCSSARSRSRPLPSLLRP